MLLRLAKPLDYPGIQRLLARYGSKMSITPAHINHRDIGVVAYDENGHLVGFMWAGLMAKNTVAYLDKVVIAPEYAGKGMHNQLAKFLLRELVKRGVRQAFGVIAHDEHHDKAAMGALKMAMFSDGRTYTYVVGDVQNTIHELKHLETH